MSGSMKKTMQNIAATTAKRRIARTDSRFTHLIFDMLGLKQGKVSLLFGPVVNFLKKFLVGNPPGIFKSGGFSLYNGLLYGPIRLRRWAMTAEIIIFGKMG
jgi:hypothetical protein